MVSDDTEHTLMVANALISHGLDSKRFQRSLGWSLRWWFLALPAGVGLSTAKAIFRLWLGFPPTRSGVRSAGNGAAMRSAIIGVHFRQDTEKRREFALASCRITHTDTRAEESAILVAEAAALAAQRKSTDEIIAVLRSLLLSEEMKSRFATLESSLQKQHSVQTYAEAMGCTKGVSGFAPNTVAVALYGWLRHRHHFSTILTEVIHCGGDTDSTGAIVGGIAGADSNDEIPAAWIKGIAEWPRSISYMTQVAEALRQSEHNPANVPKCAVWAVLPRNIAFLIIVICHGIRRLLPPY